MTLTRLGLIGAFSCLGLFLFVTAPPELPDTGAQAEPAVRVERLFHAVNTINEAARLIYTQRIVSGGKAAGLAFGKTGAIQGLIKAPYPPYFCGW